MFIKIQMDCQQRQIILPKLLCETDQQVAHVKGRTIIFFGLPKVGKSTAFNWLLGRPLMGYRSGGRVVYDTRTDNTARVSQDLRPQTLILKCQKIGGIYLTDQAGFQDSRTFQEVLAISQCSDALHQKIDSFKYIIVHKASSILENNPDQLFKPFIRFLQVHDYKKASRQTREKILGSVYVILTRADQNNRQDYYECISSIANQLQQSEFYTGYDNQCLKQVFQHLLQNRKIELFEAAREGEVAAPSSLPKQFEKSSVWTFLDKKDTTVKHFFEQDLERFPQKQKEQLKQFVQGKSNCIYQGLQIVNSFIEKCLEDKNFFQLNPDYQANYNELSAYVSKNDVYPDALVSFSLKLRELGIQIVQKNLPYAIQLKNNIEKMYSHSVNLKQRSQECEQSSYRFLSGQLLAFLNVFCRTFARTQEQQQLCIRFAFILHRSLRELSVCEKIDPGHIAVLKSICDALTSFTQKQLYEFYAKLVFEGLKEGHTYGKKLRKDPIMLNEHIGFTKTFNPRGQDDVLQFKKTNHEIYTVEADCYYNSEDWYKSIQARLKAIDYIRKYREEKMPEEEDYEQSYYQKETNQQQSAPVESAEQLQMVLQQPLEKMALTLTRYTRTKKSISEQDSGEEILSLSQDTKAKKQNELKISCHQLALEIYRVLEYREQVCKIYQKLIGFETRKQQKHARLLLYFQYAFSIGRIQGARVILQRAFQESFNPAVKKQTQKKISDFQFEVKNLEETKFDEYLPLQVPEQLLDNIAEFFRVQVNQEENNPVDDFLSASMNELL